MYKHIFFGKLTLSFFSVEPFHHSGTSGCLCVVKAGVEMLVVTIRLTMYFACAVPGMQLGRHCGRHKQILSPIMNTWVRICPYYAHLIKNTCILFCKCVSRNPVFWRECETSKLNVFVRKMRKMPLDAKCIVKQIITNFFSFCPAQRS